MKPQRYLALLLLATFGLLTACAPEAAPPPFARYDAQTVIQALNDAGATIQNPIQDMTVGRDAPATFSDRILFEVPRIAPEGGQLIIFRDQADLQAWNDYIDRLRNDPATRRSVIYVYIKDNALLQLSANLTNEESTRYRQAFEAMN
jgi:hypothetical protein